MDIDPEQPACKHFLLRPLSGEEITSAEATFYSRRREPNTAVYLAQSGHCDFTVA